MRREIINFSRLLGFFSGKETSVAVAGEGARLIKNFRISLNDFLERS